MSHLSQEGSAKRTNPVGLDFFTAARDLSNKVTVLFLNVVFDHCWYTWYKVQGEHWTIIIFQTSDIYK